MYKDKEKIRLYNRAYRLTNRLKINDWTKKYRKLNRDKVLRWKRDNYLKHKDEILKRNRLNRLKKGIKPRNKVDCPERNRYAKYQWSAKSRGHQFNLSFEEFLEKIKTRKCFYCSLDCNAGIDRIDSSKGYLKGNIVACCWPCNRSKAKMTPKEYINLCKAVAKNHSLN